eukprot:TRINITY_DN7205_c3_g1_i1.p1 TRINITY_DN7205_c3_g1~~TRINITY_DN7205_c3_g1_i1.p1  ORF type:complete len:917 (+),score=349.51 TRINITY_DN7205_c3_g1_i1:74-2824(+)
MAAPTPAELQQVADIIKSGTDVYNRDAMERVTSYIQQHSADPKFNQCLCVIACTQGASTDTTRQQAALALKNNISRNFEAAIRPCLDNTKQQLAAALQDPNDGLRNALASCVSGITKTGSWPTFVPEMWPKLKQSQDPGFRQGVLVCVRDMCEDCADQLEVGGAASQAPVLITELVSLVTTTSSTKEVLLGVESLFHLLDHTSSEDPSPIDAKFREILPQTIAALERCISLATSPDGLHIAKFSLSCYRLLLYYYDMLKSHNKLNEILQLIYKSTESHNPEVSLAACEFWHDLADLPEAVEDLATYNLLGELSKQLLNKMVYSELEVSLILAETEEEDVKPRTAKKRKDDDDDDVEQWTIRKCAASTLDALSKVAGSDLISPANYKPGWLLTDEILPRMQNGDWKVQESAVLALGAISTGCFTEVRDQLGTLVPVLLGVLQQPNMHFLVRGITCWTLGRYVQWIAPQQTYFEQYLTVLLTSMSQGERKVQECAVSSFAGLLEHESKNPGLLKANPAYIQAILKHVAECLSPGKYTTRSVVILLEAIGHLAYTCGDEIATEMGDTHLMRPLINMLMNTPVFDCVLLPQLLYCLYNCVTGMGPKFGPYVNEVYGRSLTILGTFFEEQFKFKQGKIHEAPDMGQNHTFAITLVKSLMEAMEGQRDVMVQLITNTKYQGSDFTFVNFVLMCINQPQLELESHVIMTAIDIVGENLKTYPELFLEESVKALPALLEHCNEDSELCNDCAWFCGAVVLMAEKAMPPEQLRQLIVLVANKLVPILIKNEWDENLLQNVAIAIGKCGLANPSDIAAHLDSYFQPLLNNLALVVQWDSTQEEKPQAFLGVIRLIEGNFAVLQNPENIKALAKGMSSFSNNSLSEQPDLLQAFTVTLQALKKALGGQWDTVAKTFSFPAPVLARLQ